MPLEARKAETSSIFFVNKWADQQGQIEWKRFFDYLEVDNTFTSTKLHTCGLSGMYYYEFSEPDSKAKKVNSAKLDKLKELVPNEWRMELMENKPNQEEVPSLKQLCGDWIATYGPPVSEIAPLLGPDLYKYVNILQKRSSVVNRHYKAHVESISDAMDIEETGLTHFESQLLNDIGITDSTLEAHREDILKLVFKEYGNKERRQDLKFDRKKISSLILRYSKELGGKNKVKIVLPGEPIVTISSTSLAPFMLPWKITIAKKKNPNQTQPTVAHTYYTYSKEISKLVLKYFGNSINPHTNALLDGNNWWNHKMWIEYLKHCKVQRSEDKLLGEQILDAQ